MSKPSLDEIAFVNANAEEVVQQMKVTTAMVRNVLCGERWPNLHLEPDQVRSIANRLTTQLRRRLRRETK